MKLARDWRGDLCAFLGEYRQQPLLTPRLDALTSKAFDQALVNEIVLWKVNRYAQLVPEALAGLNRLANTTHGMHRDAEVVLRLLLDQPGVDLAMASTLMRFRNPRTFQIIDRRAYRALTGARYPLTSKSGTREKVDLYFRYLDNPIALGKSKRVPFKDLDRILYIFDKLKNGSMSS